MENIKKFLNNIKPREYQERVFETCKEKNCLVVLPTGMGKTLIALMLAIERMQKFPSSKIVFLAPTRPLASQHLGYFKKHLPELFASMELFTGKVNAEKRKELWQKADIIFSTPQCVANDLRNSSYDLVDVSLLIEDECHRCLKNYDYVYVAEKFKEQNKDGRILGLTASPGSDLATIKKINENLGIEAVEIRHRESEDVSPYIQKLKTEIIYVELPEGYVKIRDLLNNIFMKKVEELKNRKLLFYPPTKKFLLECQRNIMRAIASGNKNFNLFGGASACAIAIKIQHAIEMIETQGASQTYSYLQDLFEQAKNKKSRASVQVIKQPDFNRAYILLSELISKKIEHPKLIKLIEIIKEEFEKKKKPKIIVFANYRDSTIKISKSLNELGINAKVFVGQAMKDGVGLSQKEQQEIIKDFSLGLINVLCATAIGEEGLDIPEVDAVIFYEPIPSAIRRIQRIGRTARLKPGKLIILITNKTRDESYHYASIAKERKMHRILKNMQENFDDKKERKFEANENQKKLEF